MAAKSYTALKKKHFFQLEECALLSNQSDIAAIPTCPSNTKTAVHGFSLSAVLVAEMVCTRC
jgi:hypothetical protein